VVRRGADSEAGKIKLGCLFTLCLLVVGVYFGIQYGEVRFRQYQIMDAVKEQASFVTAIDDQTMRNRLMAASDRLGLPYAARDWKIRRVRGQRAGRMIEIEAPPYTDSIVLDVPGIRKVWYFTFQPKHSEMY
jgi:hypothetical protein